MTFFKTFLASLLAVVVSGFILMLMFFAFLSALISGIGSGSGSDITVKNNTVLKLDIKGELVDKGAIPTSDFGGDFSFIDGLSKMGVYEICKTIKAAEKDDRIKGIYIRTADFTAGWASLTSIREALEKFKAAGKFIVSYSEVQTEKSYYLSSVANEVYLYPHGMMEFNGFETTPMFIKGTLDKLGVEAKIFRVGTYKSAVEPLMNEKMSEASKRQTQILLDELWNKFAEQVAASRGIQANELDSIAENGILLRPDQATLYKLINSSKYEDEVLKIIGQKVGEETTKKINFISLRKYANASKKGTETKTGKKKIAVIFAQGNITDGKAGRDGIGSESLSKLIREAREDSNVKAIVLRINSPGGSALASDVIHREIMLTKAVKPIVASMADVAASGGYYIAAPCSKIFARENTITGSIGVFGVLMNTEKFYHDKLGITYDRVATHSHADIGNPNRAMSKFEEDFVQHEVDSTYKLFKTVVMKGRGFNSLEEVDSIAQGRVWSGKEAKAIHLVDEIGGLDEAIKAAALLANLGDDYRITTLPKDMDPWEELFASFSEAGIKVEMLPEHLKGIYEQYEKIQEMTSGNGIYARMLYEYEVR